MRDIFYCHGLPGSAAEISRILPHADNTLQVIPPLDFVAFDTAVSSHETTNAHVIGFSLGAMTALKIAARRPDVVTKITLIAPAAPLELGNFLPEMAGQPVFNSAVKGRIPFSIFTGLQRIATTIAPNKIIDAMFADSPDADRALLTDPAFTASLRAGFKSSFGKERRAYLSAILTYVQPWAEDLQKISGAVTIHHGTADNWAPFTMSEALADRLPSKVTIIPYEGLGHYSVLEAALSGLLAQ